MQSIKQRVQEAADVVRTAWQASGAATQAPQVIITTGSGLGQMVSELDSDAFEMSYKDIPHLPPSRIVGHAGRLLIGRFGGALGKRVIILDGRIHGYEGHSPLTQVLPLLIANEVCGGAELAVFTNAAGAINRSYGIGELMLIKDHINFTGEAVVCLSEETNFGSSNLDMTFAYTPACRTTLKEIAEAKGIVLNEGVYIGVKGAMFETPAEIRAFGTWGADAVGMSTVHEVVAASRLGIDSVGISVLTNKAAGIEAKMLTHQEVLDNTVEASSDLTTLLVHMLKTMP